MVAGHAHWPSMASRTAYSTWTPQKPTLFDGHYLRKRSALDIGVLGYIGIVQHKEHSPDVLSIPPGTPCIHIAGLHTPIPHHFGSLSSVPVSHTLRPSYFSHVISAAT